jgi:hypothetical protein
LLNDAQATITDNSGALTLAGAGGAANPNGALSVNAGTFFLNGGSLKAGTISIGSGGTFRISKGTYTGANALSETITDNGSLTDTTTATITGNIIGTGNILAQNNADLTIAGSLTAFTGSLTIANNAVLEFGTADFGKVTFASGSSGTVKFDAPLTQPSSTTFAGTISGLTAKDFVDLADLPFTQGKMTYGYSGTAAGGTLKITNQSTNQSVSLQLVGNYLNSSWTLSKDATGGTLVVDPPATSSPPTSTLDSLVAGDLPTASSFGLTNAQTTVQNPVGSPPSSLGLDHVVALFNQFMAAGFPEQHGGQITTNALSQVTTNEQQFLANPHHG